MVQGSPYQSETAVISEVRLETRNVSGMYTTMLPMTWMGNQSRVLCSYTESFLRIGSIVYVLPGAPSCCCPKESTPTDLTGSFFCPKGAGGNGPYAVASQTISDKLLVDSDQQTFPYCQSGLEDNDRLLCCRWGVNDHIYYTVNCSEATQRISSKTNSYGSEDLYGIDYPGPCVYFAGCAESNHGICQGTDFLFQFVGQVGRVVGLDESGSTPYAFVTFNDGRTSYKIEQQYLTLEYRIKSMYGRQSLHCLSYSFVLSRCQTEIWWVVRSKTNRTVQKRKGFNVTSPQCTFDLTNNRFESSG